MPKSPEMADETKIEDADEATFASVVKRMLKTPPKPHKPKTKPRAQKKQAAGQVKGL